MKRKIAILTLVLFALFSAGLVSEARAFECCKKMGGPQAGDEGMFSKKIKMILLNEEGLGLSEEQIEKIKDLKLSAKKDLIRLNADIDIIQLDIKAAMWKDTLDTGAINGLIDKKYELKKEKEKKLVAACAALKGILTKEQKQNLKSIYKKCKDEMRASMKEGGMKRRMMRGKKDR